MALTITCLSYKCNKMKILITGQSHDTSITGFIIQIHWFGKNHFWKHWLLVFTTPRIAKQGLFFWIVQVEHYQKKNSTKTFAVSDLTEINRVSGCQGIKTMKMVGVLMLYKACSPFCWFFPWGKRWCPWCTTPVIFNTNTVKWFTCLEKPL